MTDISNEVIDRIAEACHEVNRAYCKSLGDQSQPNWYWAPEWQKESIRKGVRFHIANPTASPSQSHDEWLADKGAQGWVYGPVKDPAKKEHPCMLAYSDLPVQQRMKDTLFIATVLGMAAQIMSEAQ